MRFDKRLSFLLALLFVLLMVLPAHAQRSGPGLFQGANKCADVTGPGANYSTFCLDYSTGSLWVWSNTVNAWTQITSQPGSSSSGTSGPCFLDGGCWGLSGISGTVGIGVGQAAPNPSTTAYQVTITGAGTAGAGIATTASNATASAQYFLVNDTAGHYATMQLLGTTHVATGYSDKPDTLRILNNAPGGIMLDATASTSGSQKGMVTIPLTAAQDSGSGSAWLPFFVSAPGSPNPWTVLALQTNAGQYGQANAVTLMTPKLTSGTGEYSAYYANYCDPAQATPCGGPNDFYIAMQANGPGSTLSTPLAGILQTSAPGGMAINALNNQQYALTIATGGSIPTGEIAMMVDGYGAGAFRVMANQFQGLALPGYAHMSDASGNPVIASLAIGNSYFSAQTWANVNISGAAYYNDGTGQWVADGGAGSGVGLYSQAAAGFTFNTGPGYSAGQTVAWTRQLMMDVNGVHVDRLLPDGSVAAPTFTNCSPMAGSRDSFGYCNATAWPVTITFARPFTGANAGCVMNGGAGASGLFYTLNQTANSIQIGCVNYATGPTCGGLWFQYMCFGVG